MKRQSDNIRVSAATLSFLSSGIAALGLLAHIGKEQTIAEDVSICINIFSLLSSSPPLLLIWLSWVTLQRFKISLGWCAEKLEGP
jgi:hypothetical protein